MQYAHMKMCILAYYAHMHIDLKRRAAKQNKTYPMENGKKVRKTCIKNARYS